MHGCTYYYRKDSVCRVCYILCVIAPASLKWTKLSNNNVQYHLNEVIDSPKNFAQNFFIISISFNL